MAVDDADLLGSKITDIETRLKDVAVAQSAWIRRCEKSHSSDGNPPFVTNGRTKALKLHKVSVDGMEHPPYLWRAKRGFRFAFCGFTRHSSLGDFDRNTWCGTCFSDEARAGAEAKVKEDALDTSSSDSDASSSSESQD